MKSIEEMTDVEIVAAYKSGVESRDGVKLVDEAMRRLSTHPAQRIASSAPTKRPFLSDGEIDAESTRIGKSDKYVTSDFEEGARWARDKYEAREALNVPDIAPQKKRVLRPWHEIHQIESAREDRNFLTLLVVGFVKDKIDQHVAKAIEEIIATDSTITDWPDEWFVEVEG